MKLGDWLLTILIIIIIISFNLYMVFVSMFEDIEENWAEYKCDPSVMPFADVFGHDTMSNFYGCVQTTQSTFTKHMLAPVNYGMNMLADVGTNFQDTLQKSRTFLSTIRDKVTSIVEFIYGAFVNTVIEFQRLTIGIKDLLFKVIGIIITFLYFVDGSIKALTSLWKGPVGGAIRTVGKLRIPRIRFPRIRFPRFCFIGKNKVALEDGVVKRLDKLELGDCLQFNNKVIGIIKLNSIDTQLYSLGNTTVTGFHKVYNGKNNDELIDVNKIRKSIKVTNTKDKYLYNFVTEKGYINFGDEFNFSDWNENTKSEWEFLYKSAGLEYNFDFTEDEIQKKFNNFYYKDNLLNKDVLIMLDSNEGKTVENINPGDILQNNILVIGVVQMKLEDEGDVFYHLITDKKGFYVNDIFTNDFDSIFDKILNIV